MIIAVILCAVWALIIVAAMLEVQNAQIPPYKPTKTDYEAKRRMQRKISRRLSRRVSGNSKVTLAKRGETLLR